MGVDISALLRGKPVKLEDLTGRTVAIDAFNTIYQFLSSIRQPDGTPLMDRDGRVTSHLSGLLYRTSSLMQFGIRPAFVFDGTPPELKRKTIEARRAIREEAEKEWKLALERGDRKRALSLASRSSRLDKDMISESKSLLHLMGIPTIDAPSEGEAQMAYMVQKGDVWAGASQDFDALLFGTTTLLRNLTLAGRRRRPSGKFQDVVPEIVNLGEVLSTLEVTREQLVDMAILIGTDFNDGVHGIGPKRALVSIKRAGSLESLASEGKVEIPSGYQDIRKIFLDPPTTDEYRLDWRMIDAEGIRRLMCDMHGFSVDRIDTILGKLDLVERSSHQRCLDQWG